jgi:hypothetical protein
MGPLEARLVQLEATVAMLRRQVTALRREHRALEERVDTVCSPLWKRVGWWLQGYRWYRVGRWYGQTADLK